MNSFAIRRKNLFLTITFISLIFAVGYFSYHYHSTIQNSINGLSGPTLVFSTGLAAVIVAYAIYKKRMILCFLIYQAAVFIVFDIANIVCTRILPGEFARWSEFYAGWMPIALAAALTAFSYICAKHIRIKRYNLRMEGLAQGKRVAMISDMHLSTNIRAKDMERIVNKVNALNADLLLLCGDIFEERTTREEYAAAMEAFAKMNAEIYYVLGNHEYAAGRKGVLNLYKLREDFAAAGVTMLRDEVAHTGGISIIGRDDKGIAERAHIESLMAQAQGGPAIVMDHSPNDFADVSASGARLHLSGHTHAGQLFPFSRWGEWFGQSELMYGHRRYGGLHAIVSAGIGTWGFPMRLGVPSEIAVVDLKPEA